MYQVTLGSVTYVMFISLAIIITWMIVRLMKTLSEERKRKILFYILISAFLLHFLKLLFPPYTTHDHPFRYSTFENICAVSTLVFPWIYLSKNKGLKDYMVIIGLISGIVSFLYPVVVFPKKPLFEIFRFYYAHYIIFLVPFLMVYFKLHTFSKKRILYVPTYLILTLVIILLNEWMLVSLGWISSENWMDVNGRNPSFIFGIPDSFSGIRPLLVMFTPVFLRTNPWQGNGFFPLLWMVLPVYCIVLAATWVIYHIIDKKNGPDH